MRNTGIFQFLLAAASDELQHPPPASPVVPLISPRHYAISGRWDGVTEQGRRRFDVSDTMVLGNGSLDSSGGRLILDLTDECSDNLGVWPTAGIGEATRL